MNLAGASILVGLIVVAFAVSPVAGWAAVAAVVILPLVLPRR